MVRDEPDLLPVVYGLPTERHLYIQLRIELSNRHLQHRTPLHRLLVHPLQHRYVPIMVSPYSVTGILDARNIFPTRENKFLLD